jgi:hypothetical protein
VNGSTSPIGSGYFPLQLLFFARSSIEVREVVFGDEVPVFGLSDEVLGRARNARLEPPPQRAERAGTATNAQAGLVHEGDEYRVCVNWLNRHAEHDTLTAR